MVDKKHSGASPAKRRGGNEKSKSKSNSNEPICPITLDVIPEGEGFRVPRGRTVYNARALFQWWKNQRSNNHELTYPHNRQHPREEDVQLLVQLYRHIANEPNANLDMDMNILPIALLEPATVPTDIRRFYHDFAIHGPITSYHDPRLRQLTFRGIFLHHIIIQLYENTLKFFDANVEQKLQVINSAHFGNQYSRTHRRDMLHFTIQHPFILNKIQMIPIEQGEGIPHSIQLSILYSYNHQGHTRWMVIHYHDHMNITFNIDGLEHAEEIFLSTGYDGLFAADDTPIVFVEIDNLHLDINE